MIDIENKILQIFKKNNIPNSKIFVEVKPEGIKITTKTTRKCVAFVLPFTGLIILDIIKITRM